MALAIAQYSGIVEGTIARQSVIKPYVKMRPVVGTNTITSYAVGKSTLAALVPGTAPDGTNTDKGKNSLTVDTVVFARDILPLIDQFQEAYDCRAEYGLEHGKEIAKFFDQALFIQALKAASLTNSAFSSTSGKPAGHQGGSSVTLANAGDESDPTILMAAIRDLMIQFENKDVSPRSEDVMLAFRPQEFYTLQDAEQIVNAMYITADGTKLDNVPTFKAYGCPVLCSNNLPNTNISSHLLGSNYTGDFTKVKALAFSARAILGGETIPLTSDVFYDKLSKCWFVDSHLSFGATPNRAEFAGVIKAH